MEGIANPIKVDKFIVEIGGLDQMACQEFKIPSVEFDVTEHGDSNSTRKTAGKKKVGDAELKQLKKMEGGDSWAWNWIGEIANQNGGGKRPSEYQKTIVVRELDADGIRTINAWMLKRAWVKKVDGLTKSRTSSDNVQEDVTLSVDDIIKIQ